MSCVMCDVTPLENSMYVEREKKKLSALCKEYYIIGLATYLGKNNISNIIRIQSLPYAFPL